jgi:hypothetical protein
MILILTGSWAQAWRIGWSGEHKEIFPSDVLWWESIRWAKRNGYATFDLLGIDIRDAQELTAGRSRSEPFKCSITSSKMSIGGKILLLPGEFCFFPSPLVDSLFRGIGAPLLRTRIATRVLESLYKKTVNQG